MRGISGRLARASQVAAPRCVAVVAAAAFALMPHAADAAGQPSAKALTGKPPYQLYVLGDSFASELGDGLKWALRDGKAVLVHKRTKAATGLIRDDTYDWFKVVRNILTEDKPHIIVIAIGGNDRQDVRVGSKRYERFTKPWRAEYLKRVERLASLLGSSGAAVYWVGLPNVRSQQMTRDYGRFNGYFKDAARKHGITYIDMAKLFAGSNGSYVAYGKALDGQTRRLRDTDGIHLTNVGAQKLGEYVARTIRADMREAGARRSAN